MRKKQCNFSPLVLAIALFLIMVLPIAIKTRLAYADSADEIRQVSLRWLTEDHSGNNPRPGDPNHLYLKPLGSNAVTMQFQLDAEMESETEFLPGEIEIVIPAYIWKDRNGINIGSLNLSVPQAPETSSNFNWQRVGDNYVLTNCHAIDRHKLAMIQGSYKVYPSGVADMKETDPFEITVNIKRQNSDVKTYTSNALTAQMDTHVGIRGFKKKAIRILDNTADLVAYYAYGGIEPYLPANAENYIYVDWEIQAENGGNQPGIISFKDTAGGVYTARGEKIADGKILRFADENIYSGQLFNDSSASQRIWVAYPKYDDAGNDLFVRGEEYLLCNDAACTLTEIDPEQREGDWVDPQKTHEQTVRASAPYRVPVINAISSFSAGKSGPDRTGNLQLLRDGQNVEIPFQLHYDARALDLTYKGEDPEDIANYGKKPYTLIIEDNMIRFPRESAVNLDPRDYDFVGVSFAVQCYRYVLDKSAFAYVYEKDNNSKVITDVVVLVQYDNSSEYVPYATVRYSDHPTHVIMQDGTEKLGNYLAFPENVVAFRAEVTTQCPGIDLGCYPTVRLKGSSENVKSIVENLFAQQERPFVFFRNGAVFSAYSDSDGDNITDEQVAAQLKTADYVFLAPEPLNPELTTFPYKSMSFDQARDNDVINRTLKLHYHAYVLERSNFEYYGEKDKYLDCVADGTLSVETSCVWYDLLPPGVEPDMSSIRLRKMDAIKNAYTIPNFRGSGRTMLVVHAQLTPSVTDLGSGKAGEYLELRFDAFYSWADYLQYGKVLENYVVFESGNAGVLGTRVRYQGEPDNPRGGKHIYTPTMPDDVAAWLTDLDPETDEQRFLYAKTTDTVDADVAEFLGLTKSVRSSSTPWGMGLEGQTQIQVKEGEKYTYRLNMQMPMDTTTRGVIMLDSLENFQPKAVDDPVQTADHNDVQTKKNWQGAWQGKGQWRGKLESLDISHLVQKNIAPVIYYSTQPDLQLDSISSTADLEDTNVWQVYRLGPNETSVYLPADVTAFAIDCSRDVNGQVATFGPADSLTVYVHMRAPSGAQAEGAYAHTEDNITIDWDAAMQAENNMYAYNNLYMLFASLNDTNAHILRHVDYTRVGLVPMHISVKKVWQDEENHDGIRPDYAKVVLNAIVTDATSGNILYDGRASEWSKLNLHVNDEVMLGDINNWSHVFKPLPSSDADGNPITYYPTENPIPGEYTCTITGAEGDFTILNMYEPKKITIAGHKTWEDNGNEAGRRPTKIEITLYANGNYVDSKRISPSNVYGSWSYSFGSRYKYTDFKTSGKQRDEIVYTVRENIIPNYYNPEADENGFVPAGDLVNVYAPYGDLVVRKALENGTPSQKDREFEFKLQLWTVKNGSELTEPFAYDIFDASENVVSHGTISHGGEFSLKHDWKIVVHDLPAGSFYQIEELNMDAEDQFVQVEGGYELLTDILFGHFESVQSSYYGNGTIINNQEQRNTEVTAVNRSYTNGFFQPQVNKRLVGRKLAITNQFAFDLYRVEADNSRTLIDTAYSMGADAKPDSYIVDPVTGLKTPVVDTAALFSEIRYTAEDVGKTIIYEVKERDMGQPGYTYDPSTYTVTVQVLDEQIDGRLVLEENNDEKVWMTRILKTEVQYLDEQGNPVEEIVFENSYHAAGQTSFTAQKYLEGRQLKKDEFAFSLYRIGETDDANDLSALELTNTDHLVETVKNAEDGTVQFSPLSFDERHVGKTYVYTAKEFHGEDPTVVYANDTHVFTVTVYDNGDGTLSFAQKGQSVLKSYETLIATESAVKNICYFPDNPFREEPFTLFEYFQGQLSGFWYGHPLLGEDAYPEYKRLMKALVDRYPDFICPTCKGHDINCAQCGGAGLTKEVLRFEQEDVLLNENKEWSEAYINAWEAMEYKPSPQEWTTFPAPDPAMEGRKILAITFGKLRELGEEWGMSYQDSDIAVAFYLKEPPAAEGYVVQVTGDPEVPEFTNKLDPFVTPIQTPTPTPTPTAPPTPVPTPTRVPNTFYFCFTKEWRGTPLEDIAFTVYHPDGTVRQHRFDRTKISKTEWLYEAWFFAEADYYVIETPMKGYASTYVNIGEHADVTDRVYNGGKIINASVPKTGDAFIPALWLGLTCLSMLALGAGVLRPVAKRKK